MDRNPITLEGNLGEELDILRPHGGRPRHRLPGACDSVNRDFIVEPTEPGTSGVQSCEPEDVNLPSTPIQRQRSDPIAHTTPSPHPMRSQSMRQFKDKNTTRDPILHIYGDEEPRTAGREMRHYRKETRNYDPITHASTSDCYERTPTADTPSPAGRCSRPSTRNDGGHTERPQYTHKRFFAKVTRNPITGEGMQDSDYIDLPRFADAGYFRRQTSGTQSMRVSSGPAGQRTARQNIRKSVTPDRRYRKNKTIGQPDQKKQEQTVVKKVIRPPKKTEDTAHVEEKRYTEPAVDNARSETGPTNDHLSNSDFHGGKQPPEPNVKLNNESKDISPEDDTANGEQANKTEENQ